MSEQVLFEKKEVYIHEPAREENNGSLGESTKVGGCIQIVKNKFTNFIRFLPYGVEPPSITDDWTVIANPVLTYSKDSKEYESVTMENKTNLLKYRMQFELNELSSVRRVFQGYGIAYIVFMLSDGSTWPNLHFHKGGSKELLHELNSYLVFEKDPKDPRLWYAIRQDGQAFQQSLYELSLFNEQQNDVVKKFINQPLQSTLIGFSKVTNIFRDVLKPSDHQNSPSNSISMSPSNGIFDSAKNRFKNQNRKFEKDNYVNNKFQPEGDLMDDMLDSMSSENIHSTTNDGYEMVTKVDLGPMPKVSRGPSINKSSIIYDKDGRVLDVPKLKSLIFRGVIRLFNTFAYQLSINQVFLFMKGVDHELRIDLWKFLLNYYDWNTTIKSRTERRAVRVDDYFRMKLQWKTICDEQKLKFTLLKERENLIEKDVQRTDRTNSYFEGDDNQNLNTMKDILMTYNMYNFDLGYVQGMSDLLAPIMVIMDNEVDSFWCFVGFMNKIESNFLMDQLHIKKQLSNLKLLLEFIDPKFSHYLENNESSNMYFCFRWILILFKREFSFPDIMKLWEILWTDLPCVNFHLLICISILLMKKDDIMGNNYGFSEILRFINDLSFRINLDKTLEYAEGLYLQISSFNNLPANICEILGLPMSEKNAKDELDLLDEAVTSKLTVSSQSISNLNDTQSNSSCSSSDACTKKVTNSKSSTPINKNISYSFKRDEDSIEILN